MSKGLVEYHRCERCDIIERLPVGIPYKCAQCEDTFSELLKPLPPLEKNPLEPDHYKQDKCECIDIAEHMSFCLGNALKYIWRAGKKDASKTVEDLQKAEWYIKREITRLQKGQDDVTKA